MTSLRELIPVGFILPFLIIIVFEFLIGFGLSFYNNSLQNQIVSLEQSLKTREEALKGKLTDNEAYQAFSQFANLIEIIKKRKSLYIIVQKFTPLIPQFVEVKKLEFDSDKNLLVLGGLVDNWLDYVRLHYYFSRQNEVIFKSFKSPKVDEKSGKIEFEFSFQLKPNFYQ